MANYDESLRAQHISTNLANYEAARSGFFTFIVNDLDNIIIKYFNDIDLSRKDIMAMDNIDYRDSYELFFKLPVILYIVEYYIKKLMLKDRTTIK